MTIEKYIRGKVKHYRGGTFYLVERSLLQVDSGGVGGFIRKNKNYLLLRNIRKQFQELEHIPKQDMLFWDIETGGFDFSSPIISLALAHMHKGSDPTLQCLLARDPTEEKPMLRYFLDMLSSYEAFFSYNGKSFDAPRVQERAIHNGLYDINRKQLKDLLNRHNGQEKHLDLYHLGRQRGRIYLNDGQLQSLEKVLFQFVRRGDVESKEIPRVYYEYVYGRERRTKQARANEVLWAACRKDAETTSGVVSEEQRRDYAARLYEEHGGTFKDVHYRGEIIDEEERKNDMARLINHNLLDAASLVAVLCYLCAPAEKIVLPVQEFRLESEPAPF